MSQVTCHLSPVTCNLPRLTYVLSNVTKAEPSQCGQQRILNIVHGQTATKHQSNGS